MRAYRINSSTVIEYNSTSAHNYVCLQHSTLLAETMDIVSKGRTSEGKFVTILYESMLSSSRAF